MWRGGEASKRLDHKTHGWDEWFETMGERLTRGRIQARDHERFRRGENPLGDPKAVGVFLGCNSPRPVAKGVQQEYPIEAGRGGISPP